MLTPEGPRPGEGPQAADAHGGDEGGGGGDDAASLLPRPLDLRVPSGKAVVAITGGLRLEAVERSVRRYVLAQDAALGMPQRCGQVG